MDAATDGFVDDLQVRCVVADETSLKEGWYVK